MEISPDDYNFIAHWNGYLIGKLYNSSLKIPLWLEARDKGEQDDNEDDPSSK